jgi:hypothetical protein
MQHFNMSTLFLTTAIISVLGIYIDFPTLFKNNIPHINTKYNRINFIIERNICDGVNVGIGQLGMQYLDDENMPIKFTYQSLCIDGKHTTSGAYECFGLTKYEKIDDFLIYKFKNYYNSNNIVYMYLYKNNNKIELSIYIYDKSQKRKFTVIDFQIFHNQFPKISVGSKELDNIADLVESLPQM